MPPLTDAQKRAVYKYREKHIKRITLDLQQAEHDALTAAAAAAGESVAGFIRAAISARIASAAAATAPDPDDGQPAPAQAGPDDA